MNANAALIAAARTAVPALVAEVRRLRKELADERAQLRFIVDNQGAGSRTIVGRLLEEAQYLKENDIHPGIWRVLIIAAREIYRLTKEISDGQHSHCIKYQEGQCVMLAENERVRSRLIKMYEDNERLRAALRRMHNFPPRCSGSPCPVVVEMQRIAESALAGEQLDQAEVDRQMAKLAEGGGK